MLNFIRTGAAQDVHHQWFAHLHVVLLTVVVVVVDVFTTLIHTFVFAVSLLSRQHSFGVLNNVVCLGCTLLNCVFVGLGSVALFKLHPRGLILYSVKSAAMALQAFASCALFLFDDERVRQVDLAIISFSKVPVYALGALVAWHSAKYSAALNLSHQPQAVAETKKTK